MSDRAPTIFRVYAIVPNKPLEKMVEEAAQAAARRELSAVLHTMRLENQSPRSADRREMLEERAAEIAKAGGRRLWGETGAKL